MTNTGSITAGEIKFSRRAAENLQLDAPKCIKTSYLLIKIVTYFRPYTFHSLENKI